MAGFVHDVQKKQHRERAQPKRRKRLGLLEKKKDYKLRAADYHKKQAQLEILKGKAKDRNEDEYYHAMVHRRTDEHGIELVNRGNRVLSQEEVMLLKTQDSGYLNTMAQREAKKIERELENSTFLSEGKHTVFVDSQEQMEAFDPAAYFNTDESLLYRRENRLTLKQLAEKEVKKAESEDESEEDGSEATETTTKSSRRLKRLEMIQQRIERQKKLRELKSSLDLHREIMKGGAVKVITKDGNKVYRWNKQRKR